MMTTALVILAFGLAVLFAIIVRGWCEDVARALMDAPDAATGTSATVAHIVPARDAEDTIVPLLQDLYEQGRPGHPPSVIVVDDGSSDGTADKVRAMIPRWSGLRLLPCDGQGKKAAITTGVNATDAGWIVLTDADARCGPDRTRLLLACAERTRADMVLLPVATDGQGVLGAIQSNEQAALMMCAMATTLQGRPLLANGANMAFRRETFLELGGYTGDRFASGDDVFLVQRMMRAGKRIAALPHPGAVVRTRAEPTFSGAVQQRLRWAGKMRGVSWSAKLLPAFFLLYPWGLLALTVGINWPALVGHQLLMHALLLAGAWALWLAPVPALVHHGKRILGLPYSTWSAGLAWLAFTIYAPLIAVASLVVRPVWKGRRV